MKIKNFTKIFLFLAVAAMVSCSSSNDEGNGGDDGGGPSSITVTASNQYVDFGSAVTFTVKTNQGTDVTSDATIMVNNQGITGNSFTGNATGVYSITASYENLTSSSINITVLPVIVSIEIRTANPVYNLGERIDFQVIAFDNNDNETNISTGSAVFVDNSESMTGSKVVPSVTGTINAYATFNNFTSNTISVDVTDNLSTPMTYNKKALIEDYTGTWCGWCPRVSYGIELVQAASDDVAVVAVHGGDQMSNTYGNTLIGAFNPAGSYPTAMVNRSVEWTYPEPSNVNQITSAATGTASTGISIVTATKDNTLSFMVNAGFGENISGSKLVVLLLENGLVYNQENYTTYYGGVDVINGFVHDHVLRYAFTNVLGDAISGTANSTHRQYYNYTVPSNYNAGSLEIVAMVVGSNNQVINVNKVRAGENADF